MTIPPDFPLPRRASNSPRWLRVVRWILATLGSTAVLGAAIGGIVISLHDRSQLQPIAGGVQATGRVVDVAVDNGRGTSYAPIVEFTDQAGQTVRFQAPYSDDEPAIATPATVSYDPRNPDHAHDLSETGVFWQGPLIVTIGLVGCFVFFAPMFMWMQHFYRKALRS